MELALFLVLVGALVFLGVLCYRFADWIGVLETKVASLEAANAYEEAKCAAVMADLEISQGELRKCKEDFQAVSAELNSLKETKKSKSPPKKPSARRRKS